MTIKQHLELKIFGKSIILDPDLVARATEIIRKGGAIFNSKKAYILGKIEMANKICERKVYVRMNGLKMQDFPQGPCKYFIQVVLRTIMNHHKLDISGDCTTIVTHWVHSIAIIFPHMLAKILNYALQESKIKKVRFNFPGTLQKTIDLY